jgi:hypothetical protein
MVENELATVRRVTVRTVEKVQTNSTIQISRVREKIAEVEKGMSKLEEMIRSKSAKPQ